MKKSRFTVKFFKKTTVKRLLFSFRLSIMIKLFVETCYCGSVGRAADS